MTLGQGVRSNDHDNKFVLLAPNQVENEFLVGVIGSSCMQSGAVAVSIIHGVLVANPWTSETPDTELSFWPLGQNKIKCHGITASGN